MNVFKLDLTGTKNNSDLREAEIPDNFLIDDYLTNDIKHKDSFDKYINKALGFLSLLIMHVIKIINERIK